MGCLLLYISHDKRSFDHAPSQHRSWKVSASTGARFGIYSNTIPIYRPKTPQHTLIKAVSSPNLYGCRCITAVACVLPARSATRAAHKARTMPESLCCAILAKPSTQCGSCTACLTLRTCSPAGLAKLVG